MQDRFWYSCWISITLHEIVADVTLDKSSPTFTSGCLNCIVSLKINFSFLAVLRNLSFCDVLIVEFCSSYVLLTSRELTYCCQRITLIEDAVSRMKTSYFLSFSECRVFRILTEDALTTSPLIIISCPGASFCMEEMLVTGAVVFSALEKVNLT